MAHFACGKTLYVWQASPDPASPYTNWATAAHALQDAADAAMPGDIVLATNGVYASGGRAVYGTMTNRLAVPQGVEIRSLNGPAVTVILGQAAPNGGNGDGAIRCAYVATNATLSGFTLTNGHTRAAWGNDQEGNAGGAWCAESGTLTNCALSGNSASYSGGGTYQGMLNNCTLTDNSAASGGGGAYHSKLNRCILSANRASGGGGAYGGTLDNCTLTGNSGSYGGGVVSSTLRNCVLSENSAYNEGGGAAQSTLNNCILSENSAHYGAGANDASLNNCALVGNRADYSGGGLYYGTLNNCVLTGNWAPIGGGVRYGTLNNCVVYYNSGSSGPNYDYSEFAYSCTTPMPVSGAGNLDAEPLLASATHLSVQSPCIGRGSSDFATGVDIDGEVWLNPPCIGADQFEAGQATGALSVAISAAYTNIGVGSAVSFRALIDGRLVASAWDFGDGVVVSNRPFASHAWMTPGQYTVWLTAYNDSYPGGISASVLVWVSAQQVYYVNVANVTPAWPYTNWAGAATNIQAAVDSGTQLGRLVLVANGLYTSGGRAVYGTMTNRLVATEGVEVRSVNGPAVTVIVGATSSGTGGDGPIRCTYVGTNAVLSGFTLTNGETRGTGDSGKEQCGAGAWCEASGIVTNCLLVGNWACQAGGGAYGGTLNNCTVISNTGYFGGGGAAVATLKNCNIVGNSSQEYGGGASGATLNNCALTGNTAAIGGGAYSSRLDNCTLTANSTWGGGGWGGGGVYGGTLIDCTLSSNSASDYGGGVYVATLKNCVLTANSARSGGGAYESTLNNCTLSRNTAVWGGGGAAVSTLSNCTLSANLCGGGGAAGGTLDNCTLTGNSAGSGGGANGCALNLCVLGDNWASDGGGASGGSLNNCVLIHNSAGYGGGAESGTLSNCTVSANWAYFNGGGAYSATLYNCILYYNAAETGPNYDQSSFAYSCTTPLPSGVGNVAREPSFVDRLAGDLRLLPVSSCINAGNNVYAPGMTDLDGQTRIAGGVVDMGAYEFQGNPLPLVLGSSFEVASESCIPPNGAVDPGETVTVLVGLRNTGAGNTTNLVATLLSTNGVYAPSVPRNYGALSTWGPAVTQSFSFTAFGPCGGIISPIFHIEDGVTDIGNVMFGMPLGEAKELFREDFDGVVAPALPAGWTTSASDGQSNWVSSMVSSDSAPNAAFSPDPFWPGINELISPLIALPQGPAQVQFHHSYDLEAEPSSQTIGYDGGVLEISLGASAAFVDIISAGGSFVEGGYNRIVSSESGNPLAGRAAWSGNSGGFINTTVNLPSAASGHSIQLRWRCGSDQFIGADGWYVDTIRVQTPLCCTGPLKPVLVSPHLTNGRFALLLSGNPGSNYLIETTTNLVSWSPAGALSNVTGLAPFIDTNVLRPFRAYRARLLP